jgi:toxin HigB-1
MATSLTELSSIPSHYFHKLHGDRDETYSIRVNDQWRICFSWTNDEAFDIELVDYH